MLLSLGNANGSPASKRVDPLLTHRDPHTHPFSPLVYVCVCVCRYCLSATTTLSVSFPLCRKYYSLASLSSHRQVVGATLIGPWQSLKSALLRDHEEKGNRKYARKKKKEVSNLLRHPKCIFQKPIVEVNRLSPSLNPLNSISISMHSGKFYQKIIDHCEII